MAGGLAATVTIALTSIDATLRMSDIPDAIRARIQETRDILKAGQDRYDPHDD